MPGTCMLLGEIGWSRQNPSILLQAGIRTRLESRSPIQGKRKLFANDCTVGKAGGFSRNRY